VIAACVVERVDMFCVAIAFMRKREVSLSEMVDMSSTVLSISEDHVLAIASRAAELSLNYLLLVVNEVQKMGGIGGMKVVGISVLLQAIRV
jgi:hypothetical protein